MPNFVQARNRRGQRRRNKLAEKTYHNWRQKPSTMKKKKDEDPTASTPHTQSSPSPVPHVPKADLKARQWSVVDQLRTHRARTERNNQRNQRTLSVHLTHRFKPGAFVLPASLLLFARRPREMLEQPQQRRTSFPKKKGTGPTCVLQQKAQTGTFKPRANFHWMTRLTHPLS